MLLLIHYIVWLLCFPLVMKLSNGLLKLQGVSVTNQSIDFKMCCLLFWAGVFIVVKS